MTHKEGAEKIMPYGDDAAKGGQVEKMFDSIAPAYDFMNSVMSLGMHTHWRNLALRMAADRLSEEETHENRSPENILDIATGTGDVAFALHARYPQAHISGLDLSEGMLEIARKKSEALPEEEQAMISFRQGDSLKMNFEDATFDMITVAYGVRNFENLRQGYSEMRRVLRPGGVLCVIELSQPTGWLPLLGYRAYTRGVIPIAGRLVSGDPRAYSYLHESIEAAPQRGAMTAIMEEVGFREARWKSIFPGAVTIYTAIR
ncbi:MAG: bifunctional demethylmenaquinone methyltransferase/2-methoxy-6-polyprenyl-1,4-benzoquinol methylase UbiE [Muribaculaceae bacterium]|nr:bifunctional demethylmenaquinone methyltransferase/2-methoxy-6-polyprenyl-1,4-benzoquinol methylase UbiE [Muribaculaceae bacterium]